VEEAVNLAKVPLDREHLQAERGENWTEAAVLPPPPPTLKRKRKSIWFATVNHFI